MMMSPRRPFVDKTLKWCLAQVNYRFVRYAFGGTCATLVQFTTLVVLVEQFQIGEFEAVIGAFFIGVAVNYALQRRITFETAASHFTAAIRFGTVGALSALGNAALFAMLNAYLPYLIAQSLATFILFLINYELNRKVVFQSHQTKLKKC